MAGSQDHCETIAATTTGCSFPAVFWCRKGWKLWTKHSYVTPNDVHAHFSWLLLWKNVQDSPNIHIKMKLLLNVFVYFEGKYKEKNSASI